MFISQIADSTQSCSYPHCTGMSQHDSRSNPQGQAKGLFYTSDPQCRYPKTNDQEFIPLTKKRVGVDRAYPLKPVFHRKSHSTGEAGTDGDQNASPRTPEPRKYSYSSFGSRNWVNSSMVGPVAATQEERVMANANRTEWMQIQRLEAAGESLGEEIRRKETLLRAHYSLQFLVFKDSIPFHSDAVCTVESCLSFALSWLQVVVGEGFLARGLLDLTGII